MQVDIMWEIQIQIHMEPSALLSISDETKH